MHDKTQLSLGRIDRFVREWITPAVTQQSLPLEVTSWQAPDEPVAFAEAMAGTYTAHPFGSPWGTPWGTTWFHAVGQVPESWPLPGTRAELNVDLGWMAQQPGFQAEGAAWSRAGELIKGISPRNCFVPLAPLTGPDGKLDFYIEGASNPDVPGPVWTRPTVMGDKATAGHDLLYRLRQVAVVLVNLEAEALLADAVALRGLVDVLPLDSPRRAEIIVGLENMCDAVDADNVGGTVSAGRAVLAPLLASPAAPSAHQVYAVGHAHIDSAWLWPTRETERKVGRTVGNVLALMDEDPTFTYAFSSAQQYVWIKEKYPELYARLKQRVAEGRIVPVGGMWVESDTNMVGGEAMIRQFLLGKKFFAAEFGVDPTSLWLPDSFGYTGALPQIAALSGVDNFVTQKMSWNDTNKAPHSTFWWDGIDGTRVFSHFLPVNTYNSNLSAEELARASHNFAEKGEANKSLAPFGYGDGGGGPTREMLLQGHRSENLEGSPRVIFSGPDQFFVDARAEYADAAPTWVGELYLEYHRGTYTSQHRTKRGNRRCEHALRQAELWATAATVRAGVPYPQEALERAWEVVLLQQFHDILPGSSIAWVHREAEENYERIEAELNQLIAQSLAALAAGEGAKTTLVANASPVARDSVAPLGIGAPEESAPASLTATADGWVLDNGAARVVVDRRGHIVSALDLAANREVIPAGQKGNLLQFFRDIPNSWEAWDIEKHYQRVQKDLVEADSVEPTTAQGQPALRIVRTFSKSRVEQLLWLAAGDDPTVHVQTHVDWHETQKLLKLAFPVDVVTDHAQSETQFGYVTRTTHDNTSWDVAQFEGVGHRWVRVGEPGYGVSLANDETYGHDITRIRVGDAPASLIRASLLRAPLFPDPVSDQGEHTFHHALTLGASVREAYRQGYDLNLQSRPVEVAQSAAAAGALAPLVSVDGELLVEAVKLAEDGSGDVIVRLFEPLGARSTAAVSIDFAHGQVSAVDAMERPFGERSGAPVIEELADGRVQLSLRAFQIATLRIARA